MTSTGALVTAGRTLAALALLAVPLPVNLALTAVALTRPAPSAPRGTARRTVLLSGGKMTKSLALARSFARAGHRVVLVESGRYRLTGHRFSRAVDRFYTVPEPTAPDYAQALLRIVLSEQVDLYVPVSSPASSVPDARARPLLAPVCEVFTADAELVEVLDDKQRFAELAAGLGLDVPRSYRITAADQVDDIDLTASSGGWLLKSIGYDPAGRLAPVRLTGRDPARERQLVRGLPISDRTPWVLQEFVVGDEYCTHSTVRGGRVQMWACCPSSAWQLNYTQVEVPQIERWVRRFCAELGVTGQFAFDFILTADGRAVAIECNPRTHSAVTMFYDHPDVADAYLTDRADCLRPLPGSRPTYWLYHELWRLLQHPATLPTRVRTVLAGKDAVFDRTDPLPFLLLHHLQVPDLLLQDLRAARRWIRIDFNIGKLVEPSGGLTVPLDVLHLVGSAVSEFHARLSRLYAADCLSALADPSRYTAHIAYVSPDGQWRFPADLSPRALATARPVPLGAAVTHLQGLGLDAVVPQMFCLPGMTTYRALFDLLGVPCLGNPAAVMALAADKAKTRAVVAAAGVGVPAGRVVRPGQQPALPLPVVVKPVDNDNSLGVTLVRDPGGYDPAVRRAATESTTGTALVERYVELGREVRCGVLEQDGRLVCLPLEEYDVDTDRKPVRTYDDKLATTADGDLHLMAKTDDRAWIVDVADPLTERVWQAARSCHTALGCRQYSLFDFRVDPGGRPWFLEAGLYCSFARTSVLAVMAQAAGTDLPELFELVLRGALSAPPARHRLPG